MNNNCLSLPLTNRIKITKKKKINHNNKIKLINIIINTGNKINNKGNN